MMHLRKSSVLVSGIGSVGVEIAKNLILGGVRQVTLHDTANAQWIDLSAQYYLNQKDLGHNRAAASFEYLAELNDSVTCSLSVDALTEDFVKKFEVNWYYFYIHRFKISVVHIHITDFIFSL